MAQRLMEAPTRIRMLSKMAGIAGMGLIIMAPATAWANQPPAQQLALGVMLLLPLMMLFTAIGGGYAILRARNKTGKSLQWALAAIVAILFSFTQEGWAFLLSLIFVGIALARGIQMIVWGTCATRPPEQRASYLAQAVPIRLIAAGVSICAAAIFIAGLSFAFIDYWPMPHSVEEDIKKLVAYQFVKGKEHHDAAGNPRYEDPRRNLPGSGKPRLEFEGLSIQGYSYRYYDIDFRVGTDTKSFEIWAWPRKFPFFPYNYLTFLPSFYANDSGQLRMIRVYEADRRCPPDAHVYYRITPDDLRKIQEMMKRSKESE